jgi:protein MON2
VRPSISHFWHADLPVIKRRRLCSDAEFMRSVWQRYDALANDGDASNASCPRVFTLLISALKRLVTSRPSLLGISAQMHGVGVPASDSLTHLHSHHSLDTVAEMVATAASATVSNVVGMIGTEAGLSVQTAAMKVQWCVSLANVPPAGC